MCCMQVELGLPGFRWISTSKLNAAEKGVLTDPEFSLIIISMLFNEVQRIYALCTSPPDVCHTQQDEHCEHSGSEEGKLARS